MIYFNTGVYPAPFDSSTYELRMEVTIDNISYNYTEYYPMQFIQSNFDGIWKAIGEKIKFAIAEKQKEVKR